MTLKRLSLFIILLLSFEVVKSQDPTRFSDHVSKLAATKHEFKKNQQVNLFVGSSSILRWTDIKSHFPGKNIINNGFGGSHMSDLHYYIEELVIRHSPDRVFIYEGDNDIASGKSPNEIMQTTREVIHLIESKLKGVEIVIISAKPSIKRWHLKENYTSLNTLYKDFCASKKNLHFADVWSAMITKNGELMQHLFVKDGIHMNSQGYAIWTSVLKNYF